MESAVEASQSGGPPKLKPSLGPKPRLAPKPFSLQKSTAVRSINAPKTVHDTFKSKTEPAENPLAAGGPKPPLTASVQILPQPSSISASKPGPVGVSTKPQPTPSNASEAPPHKEDGTDPGPATKTTPPKETPEFEPVQKDHVVQTNHKTSTDTETNSEQEDRREKDDETQKPKDSSSDSPPATNSEFHRGGSRKRLSMELTSKFELGGPLPPPQPVQPVPKTLQKSVSDKPAPPVPKQSQAAPEPANRESDAGEQGEDYSGGNSIKLRISRLFDSVSKLEVTAKREELEIPNGIGGVKEQIKNWAAETGSESPTMEKMPQVAQRIGSKR